MGKAHGHAAITACENCATPLQGDYCHHCGQGVHSPVRNALHALEEIFESFWHLDGRAWTTLRDLFSPGRVACNYLAGQRVRYIAPLRLFIILSLVTFFVGKLTVHVDDDSFSMDGREARIESARTIPEVERVRDEMLAELRVAEKKAAQVPGVNTALVTARVRIQGEAAERIAELREIEADRAAAGHAPARAPVPPPATPVAADTPTTTTAAPPPARKSAAAAGAAAPASQPSQGVKVGASARDEWKFNDRPWDEKTNPVDVGWLPPFADRWLNHRIGRAKENLNAMDGNPDLLVQAFLGNVPTALFLLMPVFALLLKVLYLGSGRLYLEHVVVALYSHAWLLLVLLALFLLSGLNSLSSALWVSITTTLVSIVAWCWVPVYLFLMQLRVYREHWLITLLKYLMIGSVYMVLVTFATAFAFLGGIVA